MADVLLDKLRALEETLGTVGAGGSAWTALADRLHARKELADLLPAIIAQMEGGPTGWQPIETAPNEGLADILVDGDRRYAGCHYDQICEEWRHITACGVLIRLKNATHWHPLPTPPKGKA